MAISESMRLLWIGGLTDCTGARSWTTDKLFRVTNVTACSVGVDDFSLYLGNAKLSTQYFAHEADRFASAAFETLLTSVKQEAYSRSTGWLLIKAYYAAFFATHSLMRLHGWACTRLSSENLSSINREITQFFPGSQKFVAGLYLVKSESGGSQLRCRPLDSSIGGTHEILWSLLRPFFDEAVEVVLSSSNQDGQNLAILLSEFLILIDRAGGPKWFSSVRNRLNYAHDYGAWFPYIKSTSDYDRLEAVLKNWSNSPESAFAARSNDELVKFSAACAFLVSLCCATVKDLTYRSKPKSPFRQSCGLLV